MLTWLLFLFNLAFLVMEALFAYESRREGEVRAQKIGMAGAVFHFLLGLAICFFASDSKPFGVAFWHHFRLFSTAAHPPPEKRPDPSKALQVTWPPTAALSSPWMNETQHLPEIDVSFPVQNNTKLITACTRSSRSTDDLRREKGGPLGRPGSIDGGYQPNVSMLVSSFALPNMLGRNARVDPGSAVAHSTYTAKSETSPSFSMEPEKATLIVKDWARHLGADLVGICKVDPRWAYSHKGEIHYGEWEEWGSAIPKSLPYAVVVATAMGSKMVATAPHTPAVVESGYNYARGAYITTIMAQWFGSMGYRAVAGA